MILATEGTSSYPFNRLMIWIEALIARGFIQEEVVVLSGSSTQVPPAIKRYESRTESCLTELSLQASLIISDCDAARLQLLDRTAKPYILVPRTSSYNEFMDDRPKRPQRDGLIALPGRHRIRNTREVPVTHPSVRSLPKRLIDIVGALVGLLITAVLYIPIAIAIELDSPGPIFFGQIRCGWMGRRFKIWKFRSMVDAEALKGKVKNQAKGAFFKNDNDPRVTPVGRFLRRTSLDEFPQFWNVLKGEMSLVGTRPPTPDEIDRYEIPKWRRLDVKPGITGEWQVNGRSQIRDFEDVICMDLRYQENWSLMYDIKLIVKTIAILFRKNYGAV